MHKVGNNSVPLHIFSFRSERKNRFDEEFVILDFQLFLFRLSQPVIISKLLVFYEPNQTEMTKDEACIYGALLVFVTLMRVVLTHNYLLGTLQLSMKIRVAASSLIYRKALKLNKFALAETTIGQMVNLLSNDVSRFNTTTQHINFLWLSPLETALVMYLLYINVGITGLAGTFFLLLFIPFQSEYTFSADVLRNA